MTKSQEKIKELVPFLVQFKRRINANNRIYCYDEEIGLNVVKKNEQTEPVVLIPGSLAMLKTKTKAGGED